jgi:hypothetical protein
MLASCEPTGEPENKQRNPAKHDLVSCQLIEQWEKNNAMNSLCQYTFQALTTLRI